MGFLNDAFEPLKLGEFNVFAPGAGAIGWSIHGLIIPVSGHAQLEPDV